MTKRYAVQVRELSDLHRTVHETDIVGAALAHAYKNDTGPRSVRVLDRHTGTEVPL